MSSAPPPPTMTTGPVVLRLFGAADYPAEALINRWEGSVVADPSISVAGQVTKCRIVQSSGHPLLDNTTCRILSTRAVFRPATDQGGKPVESVLRTPPIVWAIF